MADTDFRPGLEGVIALETDLSFLDVEHEEIVIRGYSLIELAKTTSYLDVSYLIWHGELPASEQRQTFEESLRQAYGLPPAILNILGELPKSTHLMDALRTGVSALAGFDPDLDDQSEAANAKKAVRLLAKVPEIVAASHHIKSGEAVVPSDPQRPYSANFLHMITGKPATEREVQAFDRLLIVYSEHEMPNSTFAARVIASTLSDMYGALTGAVASLKGPLHGGANEAVMRMLLEAGKPERMESHLRGKLANRERIMGFGHRVYMHKPDPRAMLMKETLAEMVDGREQEALLEMCEIGERVMREEKGLYPNLDYYAAPVYYLLGIPIELYTPIFFAARTIGLTAHVMEQHAKNRLFRPRVRYLGPRGKHPGGSAR